MGGFLGTLDYIAPEQIEGRVVDGRADQYALAAIAVACLTGQVPFPRDSDVAIINAHLHDAPPSVHLRVPDLPIEADAVIARGMAKAPDDRYPDCRAFVDELRDAVGVTATFPRATTQRTSGQDLRAPLIVGVLVILGLVALTAFVMASSGGLGPSSSAPGSLAATSPSSSVDASPTEDIFPNTAEASPCSNSYQTTLRVSCQRGRYNTLLGNNGPRTPIASLECTPGVTAGASSVADPELRAGCGQEWLPGRRHLIRRRWRVLRIWPTCSTRRLRHQQARQRTMAAC